MSHDPWSTEKLKAEATKDDLLQLNMEVMKILNKLSPENFSDLVQQLLELKFETPQKMAQLVLKFFSMAVDSVSALDLS